MFPSQLFSLFPPFPRSNRVFVAMSFAECFSRRWEEVIAPAIARVSVGGSALEPHRVDTRMVSDSILTEILDGISNDLIVFADVSALGEFDGFPVRNGNVMYEVGLAHAVRLPEEVLLFRSDDARLLFDIASVRVTSYDPDGDPSGAQRTLAIALANAIAEVDLRRHKAVQSAARSLGYEGWILLLEAASGLKQPVVRTPRDVMNHMGRRAAIPRLLDLGLIKSEFPRWDPGMPTEIWDGPAEATFRYSITPFGEAVLEASMDLIGVSLENLAQMAELLDQGTPEPGAR